MVKTVLYQYLGTNGMLITPIHLEDVYYVRKIRLEADPEKVLTKNGGKDVVLSVVVPEDEVSEWEEIALVKDK